MERVGTYVPAFQGLMLFRLLLASLSPMLANLMQADAEEEEVIYVEGAHLHTLNQIVQLLYNGTGIVRREELR